MQTHEPFYLHSLRESLFTRQKRNPGYSLRAFAKDLEIDSSNLSAVMNKKRGLPTERAHVIARKLKLSPKEQALFIASTFRKQTRLDKIQVSAEAKKYLLDDKYFKIVSEWEYYALLQLMSTESFRSDIDWLAMRLDLSSTRTKHIVENLIALKFIELDSENNFRRLVPRFETTEDVESQALQHSHFESLRIAQEKIDKTPVIERDYSSMTMAIDPSKLSEAKAIIREFQDKLETLLSNGKKTEVYQFSCQLFPLTKKEPKQ